ncbi:MAG: agmatinase [Pseudomonadota bacterium]|jgi:agmatinase
MTDFAFRATSHTFLKCDVAAAGAGPQTPFGIAGLAWDGSVTNRPGARFGPRQIRLASHMLCDATHPHFDLSPTQAVSDHGDLPLPNTSLEGLRAALEPQARALMAGQHMIWLGGDHALTLSLLKAACEVQGRPLAVLHFDAHCDTWTDHFGEPSGHGTWVYEAMQAGLVEKKAFVQVGIRSSGEKAARDYVTDQGGLIHTARALRGLENPGQLSGVIGSIERRWADCGQPPVYLSLDIDCLDPAFAPGTGTPEPGGMSSNQVLTLLEELAGQPFVGMDCVEVAPPYDHAELTSLNAAHFVWTYLCGRVAALRQASAARA